MAKPRKPSASKLSDMGRELARLRWSKDKRTKAERAAQARAAANARWAKRKKKA